MAQWFRMYARTLNSPKAQRLPGDLFKAWVNLMCLACERDGHVPSMGDIAFSLRITDKAAEQIVSKLISADLIHQAETGYVMHDWDEHQFKSDVSTDRVKRHRERKSSASGNVDETFQETPETKPVTPPDTESEKKEEPNGSSKEKSAKGTRLPPDWQPSAEDVDYAISLGLKTRVARITEDFRDYWHSRPGKDGTKLDWTAVWKTWCRREADKLPQVVDQPRRMGI